MQLLFWAISCFLMESSHQHPLEKNKLVYNWGITNKLPKSSGGLGSAWLMGRLNDLHGVFQLKWFYVTVEVLWPDFKGYLYSLFFFFTLLYNQKPFFASSHIWQYNVENIPYGKIFHILKSFTSKSVSIV